MLYEPHDRVSSFFPSVRPFFHVSDLVIAHDRVSFIETILPLGTLVFSHPYSSATSHAPIWSPHGHVFASKSLSLGFHNPNSFQWTPWNTISFKIHQMNPNNSSKNVESLYKILLYQIPPHLSLCLSSSNLNSVSID